MSTNRVDLDLPAGVATAAGDLSPRLIERLRAVRHVALDMDGTIYRGAQLFPFTSDFLATLRRLNIGYTFLTNNSSKSVADYVTHVRRIGLDVSAEQIFTSTHATIAYLKEQVPSATRLYVLGTASMQSQIAEAGYSIVDDDPEAVVVGFDTALVYERLCKAAYFVEQGLPYVASHPDRFCPTDLPTVLVDCGAICAAIEYATKRAPDAVVGKPDPWMLKSLQQTHDLPDGSMAMVGDRLATDIAMACRAEALGVLVLTGDSTAAEAADAVEPPDLILPSLKELGPLLLKSRNGSTL